MLLPKGLKISENVMRHVITSSCINKSRVLQKIITSFADESIKKFSETGFSFHFAKNFETSDLHCNSERIKLIAKLSFSSFVQKQVLRKNE